MRIGSSRLLLGIIAFVFLTCATAKDHQLNQLEDRTAANPPDRFPDGGQAGAGSRPAATAASPRHEGFSVGNAPVEGVGYRGFSDYTSMRHFYWRLSQQFGYTDTDQVMRRFSDGDPALTPRIMRMALLEPADAAKRLVTMTHQLRQTVVLYQQQKLDRDSFRSTLTHQLEVLRKLSRRIQKDEYLQVIDQRPNRETGRFNAPTSLDELTVIVEEISKTAAAVSTGLDGFYHRDLARVVSLNDLNQPSFRSLSDGIDKMARAIQKSKDRF